MPRVVSLVPSATEMVCALGQEKSLVGRSHECDYPASVRKLPICTEPSDKHVKVREDVLLKLKPDILLTQSVCDVCAVSAQQAQKYNASVVSLGGTSLEGIWNDLRGVAKALGVPQEGDALVNRLTGQIAEIRQKARGEQDRPRVACIEWLDPLMIAGNWVPELVELAGGFDVLGVPGKHSDWTEWDKLIEKDPDILVVMPCGYDIKRTREEIKMLTKKPGWVQLQAVNNNRVFLVDGNQYFNRPGPRLVESVEILAELLHPETFDFGHKMTGWQYL